MRPPMRGANAPREGVGVTYSAEAEALFARFTTPPDAARKALIDATIVSLKTTGVWSKLVALYVEAAADSQAARRNWVADQYNLTAVASPSFTADRGFTSDGTSSYLSTGFNPSTAGSQFAQDSASIFAWCSTNTNPVSSADIGNTGSVKAGHRNTANADVEINSGGGTMRPAQADTLGLTLGSRTGSAVAAIYRNGSLAGSSVATSMALANEPIYICTGNTVNFSVRRQSAGGYGSGLSAQNVADLYAALNTYLTAVGAA